MAINRAQRQSQPYEVVGSGRLVSTVWKSGEVQGGWRFRFNLFRQCDGNGRVSQMLRPTDIPSLVKLCQVLAMTLADDGCLDPVLRRRLRELATNLDGVVPAET